MAIADNVSGSKIAQEAFDLVSELIRESDATPEAKAKAWRKVNEMVSGVLQEEIFENAEFKAFVESRRPMTKEEAVSYERQTVDFGKHSGKTIAEVPAGYLDWIHSQERDSWKADLGRYLASRYVKDQQEYEDDDE